MRLGKSAKLAGAAVACLGAANGVYGAAQVALHQVNTSVGLLPSNAANKWKLQTDPVVTDPDFSQYIPIEGSLCMKDWRVTRPANQTRKHRGLRQGQLANGLVEIIFGGRLKAVIAVRQVDLVCVHREDL